MTVFFPQLWNASQGQKEPVQTEGQKYELHRLCKEQHYSVQVLYNNGVLKLLTRKIYVLVNQQKLNQWLGKEFAYNKCISFLIYVLL